MVNFNEYAQLCITANVAKQFPVSTKSTKKWKSVIEKHRKIKTRLALEIKKKLPSHLFLSALNPNSNPTTLSAKRAHQLLHYNPTAFINGTYLTREAFVYAVYSAHYCEKQSGPKLALWFKEI